MNSTQVSHGRNHNAFFQQYEFQAAVTAMDNGDVSCLKELLAAKPELARLTVPINEYEPTNYFTGPSLIHYVAGNPNRGNLPQNIVESAAALLQSGADPNARTLAGSTTIGLILTSKDASDSEVAPALIELLKAAGATDDLDIEETLLSPLRNCAYKTARALWEKGLPASGRRRGLANWNCCASYYKQKSASIFRARKNSTRLSATP